MFENSWLTGSSIGPDIAFTGSCQSLLQGFLGERFIRGSAEEPVQRTLFSILTVATTYKKQLRRKVQ